MQINAIVSMYQKISGQDNAQQTRNINDSITTDTRSQDTSNHDDLNNLSPEELESMLQGLDDGKQLSEQNTMMFSLQRQYLEQFGLKY